MTKSLVSAISYRSCIFQYNFSHPLLPQLPVIQPVLWGGAGAVPVGDAEPVLVDEVHVVGSGADGLSGGVGCQIFGNGWRGKGLAWIPEFPGEGAAWHGELVSRDEPGHGRSGEVDPSPKKAFAVCEALDGVEEVVGFVPAGVSEVAAEPSVVLFGKGTEPADAVDRVGDVLFGFSVGGQP